MVPCPPTDIFRTLFFRVTAASVITENKRRKKISRCQENNICCSLFLVLL